MALEWRDIGLAKRQLSIARSQWKAHVTAPKGGHVRHVPLTERLLETLKAARHLRGPRVICDEKGQPLTQKVVQLTVRRVATRAHVKPGVHILRHTFCSHLAMRGAPARVIQELAGHVAHVVNLVANGMTPAQIVEELPDPCRGRKVSRQKTPDRLLIICRKMGRNSRTL